MNVTHLVYSARHACIAATLIVALGIMTFFAFEPSLSRGQEVFTVSQTITDEISFSTIPADVSMSGSIQGFSGGYATGSTMVVIRTNDAQGYRMTLVFSSTTAMSASSSAYINNYTPATINVPDYDWVTNSTGQAAEFGYTVRASTTAEADQSFLNNGSLCNTGAGSTDDKCWLNPSTTAETIILTTQPAAGSTSTIKFKVAVPNSPSPSLPTGTYVATGTLTATNNP